MDSNSAIRSEEVLLEILSAQALFLAIWAQNSVIWQFPKHLQKAHTQTLYMSQTENIFLININVHLGDNIGVWSRIAIAKKPTAREVTC